MNIFKYEECINYDALAMNVYLEKEKATKGKIQIEVCSIPNGDGYWYQSGGFTLDPLSGEEITTPGGRKLLKYYVYVPLNGNPEDYGKYPFSENVEIRNVILALHNEDSDYDGRVYYDNIRYVDVQNLDGIDTDINRKYHDAYTGGGDSKEDTLEKGKKYEVDNVVYKVLDNKEGGSVELVSVKKQIPNVLIKDTVVINGIKCKVTAIAKNVYKNSKKLKSITIGKNVKRIGKKAFYNCKKLSVITINTTKLTEKNVGANAFGKDRKSVV